MKRAAPPAPPPTLASLGIIEDLQAALLQLPTGQRRALLDSIKERRLFSRDPAGGVSKVLSLKDELEEYSRIRGEDFADRAGRYHFSSMGMCFRRRWYEGKGRLCDCGNDPRICPTHRFAPGRAEPGNAVENHFRLMQESVYAGGKEGTVLKDVRFSEAIPVPLGDGTTEDIHLAGRSDPMIVGDNLRIRRFTEVKTPFSWPDKKRSFVKSHGHSVPLALARIDVDGRGLVNLNQALQLCAGVHIMAKHGNPPERIVLVYADRGDFDNHLEIVITLPEAEVLHDFAVWWATEHHLNLKDDRPPPPQFMMGWECNRSCPFPGQCLNDGGKRALHPAVIDINGRLDAANEAQPAPRPSSRKKKK